MGRLVRAALVAAGCALGFGVVIPGQAYAHGFGERYDLPVPLWLYVGGAGATVALSFVVIGLFVRGTPRLNDYPRLNLLRWRAGRVLVHPAVVQSIKTASVALFGLVIVAGLIGDTTPVLNLAPTMVWVVWWVGLAYVCALVGDVWALINPLKTIFEWADRLYRLGDVKGELSFRCRYPDQLGVWPGVFLFLVFAWVEIVYGESAIPSRIAQLMVAYSLITWGGMLLFGKDEWLRRGEAFSLAFGLLARFAPTEVRVVSLRVCRRCPVQCADRERQCIGCGDCFGRASAADRELNLRPFSVGLLRNEAVSSSMLAFVVLLLSTLTFDGFTATPLWGDVQVSLYDVIHNSANIKTLGLIAFPLVFMAVYLAFSMFMAAVSGKSPPVGDVARAFVYSLVPIALAYHLAHFFSFLLIQGQLIIPLSSDPFGYGWDLFGTAGYRINIGIVDARLAWVTAVGAIVMGHTIAVYLAHVISLRTMNEGRAALRSQYPMLALMVGYTMVSLWILAQPIVAET